MSVLRKEHPWQDLQLLRALITAGHAIIFMPQRPTPSPGPAGQGVAGASGVSEDWRRPAGLKGGGGGGLRGVVCAGGCGYVV